MLIKYKIRTNYKPLNNGNLNTEGLKRNITLFWNISLLLERNLCRRTF